MVFKNGQNVESLGLTGNETFSIEGLGDDLQPMTELTMHARRPDGSEIQFQVIARLNTVVEVNYLRNGGILHTVLRNMIDK